MTLSKEHIHKQFGQKLRVRACGILIEEDKILLIKHDHLGEGDFLWSPPGGGVEFGESVHDCLVREFREETGLEVDVERFLFVNEFLAPPLHAFEIFFLVQRKGGHLVKGIDPEMDEKKQLILEIQFKSIADLHSLKKVNLHEILHNVQVWDDLLSPTVSFFAN